MRVVKCWQRLPRGSGCLIPRDVEGQFRQGSGQCNLAEDVPAYCREVGLNVPLMSLSIPHSIILWNSFMNLFIHVLKGYLYAVLPHEFSHHNNCFYPKQLCTQSTESFNYSHRKLKLSAELEAIQKIIPLSFICPSWKSG